jgi:hypothetical protein
MLYIMKNYQVKPGILEYVLFNDQEQTKSYLNATPKKAETFKKYFNMQSISPLESMPMLNYEVIELGMFIPLPF